MAGQWLRDARLESYQEPPKGSMVCNAQEGNFASFAWLPTEKRARWSFLMGGLCPRE